MRIERLGCLLVLGALAVASGASAGAELRPLIPRDVLFGNPERTSPQISPDGKRLGWLAQEKKNVLQVWVKTIGNDDAKMVTADKKRGIRQYLWAQDNHTLLYLQDSDGDENYHVYGVNLDNNTVRDYTPFQGIRAIPTKTSPRFPNTILVSVNARDRRLFDVYRVDLATGATTLDTKNPGDVAGFLADDKLAVRGAQVISPQGGTEIRIRADAKSPWKTMLKVGPAESLGLLHFTADGRSVYLQSSIGSDTARVVEHNLVTGAEKEIANHPDVDAGRGLIHPTR